MTDQEKLTKAINGWKQAIAIMSDMRDSLDFALDEIEAHKRAFPKDDKKAEQFVRARAVSKTVKDYLFCVSPVLA